MARQKVPGLTLAVVRQGRIVRLGAHGFGDLEWRARATPDTRFEIASISKMFTGAAVRILVDEGRLDLETPIHRYFDGLPDSWAGMKVRHLLTMSTGLPEDWGAELIPYDADVTTPYDDASMVRAFTTLKMEAPVGTEFHYSSPGYSMLGMIVSRLAGQSLPEFVAARVFKPADMRQSSFLDNSAIVPERAQGYRLAAGQIRKGWYVGQYLHARPDVGVLSTAGDLARWVIAVREGRIVKDPGRLWEGSTADSGRALDYSYGWSVETLLGRRLIKHGGRYRTGFRATLDMFPDDDLSVVVLANCDCANVDAFSSITARFYLPDLPSPELESTKPDSDPVLTASVIAALKAVAGGRIEAETMAPDALEPITLTEASGLLRQMESFGFAGRGRLRGAGLVIHGHRLVDYVTIKLDGKPGTHFLTVYRDEHGRIAYLELTV
jgi:CubicO group peptidase (beta-lactamase class C family)